MHKQAEEQVELARLVNRKGDLDKRWYVEYYTWEEDKPAPQRKQLFAPASLKSADARESWARETIKHISEKAASGQAIKPLSAKSKQPAVAQYTFVQAIELAISSKFKTERQRTVQTYRSFLNIFKDWSVTTPLAHIPVTEVDDSHIMDFLSWLQAEKKIGNTTYNNYLQRLTTAFNSLIKKEIIKKNPCHPVEALPEETGKNVPLNFHQRLTIEKFLQEHNMPLFRFTRFLYFTFLRPNELVQLRVKDIDMRNRQILVPAEISKNRKLEPVTIPKLLLAELAPMRLDKYAPDAFVFSKDLLPGSTKVYPTYVSEMHRRVLIACGIKQKDISLYSWRHTGVVNAYKAGIDIKTLQIHIRHQNMEMTNSYLERLGLGIQEGLAQREW